MKILVTRPQVDQLRTCEALAELGIETVSSPLMDARPLPLELPHARWQGIIVTSRNALRQLAPDHIERISVFPFYCVGERTTDLARSLGLRNVHQAAPNAHVLSKSLAGLLMPAAGPLLYLTGRQRTDGLEAVLRAEGFELFLREVYEMVPRETLSSTALDVIGKAELDGILLYSERSCRLMLSQIERYSLQTVLHSVIFYCLSPAVALPLQGRGYPFVVAKAPNERSLLASLGSDPNL